ncbi:MAG TPA: carbohydrate binding domain-containing protein [Actinomycetes bacterium]|nr:carbohydrate binding domain-containing protein [Actinomycetes bacterium]
MATRAPRHLAEPPRRFGLSPLQQVFLGAMIGLAAITLMIALLTRDTGDGGRRAAAPATTRARAATTTTAPATRPIRPTPGNLLADGDFERDLAGWAPLGEAELERVEGGASGRWAAAVTPDGSRDGQPGMVRRDAATTEAGTTYEAIFWVQAPAGGQVVLALRELAGGRELSADEAGYTLSDGNWRQLAVEHHTAAPGSSLALEVVGHDLGGDGRLLVDGVDLQTE